MTALVLAALVAAAPSDGAPWGQLGLTLEGGAWATGSRSSKNATGTVNMTWFSPSIADDGAPYALQPYLQRLSTLNVSGSFGGFATSDTAWPESLSGADFFLSLAANRYLTDRFALTAGGSFERLGESGPFFTSPSPSWLLPMAYAGGALRIDDTRVDLQYRYQPAIKDGDFDSRGFGRIYLNAETVIDRKLALNLQTHTLPSGGSAHAGVEYYLDRRLNLGAGFTYAAGQVFLNSNNTYRQLTPSADLEYWFTPLVRGSVTYSFIRTDPDASNGTLTREHKVALLIGTRLD